MTHMFVNGTRATTSAMKWERLVIIYMRGRIHEGGFVGDSLVIELGRSVICG